MPLLTLQVHRESPLSGAHPLRFGLPFPRGMCVDPVRVQVRCRGEVIPSQFVPLSTWPGGSCRWGVCSLVLPDGEGAATCAVDLVAGEANPGEPSDHFRVHASGGGVEVQAPMAPDAVALSLCLSDATGADAPVRYRSSQVLEKGGVVTVWRHRFTCLLAGREMFIDMLMYCWHGCAAVALDVCLHNPAAAVHADNLWDLGDPHSVHFSSCVVSLPAPAGPWSALACVCAESGTAWHSDTADLLLRQFGSGGENWQSRNHVDARGEMQVLRNGGEALCNGVAQYVKRLSPTIAVQSGSSWCALALPEFWERFPAGFTGGRERIGIDLFPPDVQSGPYELQPGERAVKRCVLALGESDPRSVRWAHAHTAVQLPADWVHACGAVPCAAPLGSRSAVAARFEQRLSRVVSGEERFARRRELIDEYGWRNFGDLYADHEARYRSDGTPALAHYNNQYDSVYWSLLQFWRSGDPAWFHLHDQAARHVRDVDVYHTSRDRFEYNGGLFWHTLHYLEAETATHRAYSRRHVEQGHHGIGGGPSDHHCYCNGVIHHFLATGDYLSRDAAMALLGFVRNQVRGPAGIAERARWKARAGVKRVLRLVRPPPRSPYDLGEGPGRAGANMLQGVVDGFYLTGDVRYLVWGERLVYASISPRDSFGGRGRDLDDIENRWMYTMFLQALGSFLEAKEGVGAKDEVFDYARQSLVHYVAWMLEHERPYLERESQLEYPNETWAAQELRKVCAFLLGARYGCATDFKKRCCEKAAFFYRASDEGLERFGDMQYLTRPLVLLMAHQGVLARYLTDDAVAGWFYRALAGGDVVHGRGWCMAAHAGAEEGV